MSVERVNIVVQTDGVTRAIADAKRLSSELDKTTQAADRTQRAVDRAPAQRGGLMGFFDRALAEGFFKRSGFEFGPVEIGRGGIGFNRGFMNSRLGQAGLVAGALSHGTGTALNTTADTIEEWKRSATVAEFAERRVRRATSDVAQQVDGTFGISKAVRGIYRLAGVQGEDFDLAYSMLLDDWLKTDDDRAREREREAAQRRKFHEETARQMREFGKETQQLIAEATAFAEVELRRRLAAISVRGANEIRFTTRAQHENYEIQKRRVNEPLERWRTADMLEQAKKAIANRGG